MMPQTFPVSIDVTLFQNGQAGSYSACRSHSTPVAGTMLLPIMFVGKHITAAGKTCVYAAHGI